MTLVITLVETKTNISKVDKLKETKIGIVLYQYGDIIISSINCTTIFKANSIIKGSIKSIILDERLTSKIQIYILRYKFLLNNNLTSK